MFLIFFWKGKEGGGGLATFLWILDCIVSACWRILFCGVVWFHALFPGLLRCFPAFRFPDDSSIELACAVCVCVFFFFVFFFFFFVRRRSCGFWIVWCPFVGVSSSVGLSGFMRCFLAICAVSRLFGSLMILRSSWLALCFFFFVCVCVCVCVATFLWILDYIVFVCWRILFCGVVWSHALFPGLLRCFPALRFPDDSSIVLAFDVGVFFLIFFCVWRSSCGFWIVLCPFVGVSSSVRLSGLMRCFLACWAVSRLFGSLMILPSCLLFFFFFSACFFFGVRRLSCGFWIVWCPFVGVSSSVELLSLMRCFLACCFVSWLFGSLMILRSCWLALCVCVRVLFFFVLSECLFFSFCFFLCGDVPVDFGLYCIRLLACPLLWGCLVYALFPGLLRCFLALRFPDDSSIVLAFEVFFIFFSRLFFFWCVATFLWILDCIASVCWRILFCGVVWSHALFPGLLGCFPALWFPDDSSIVLACALCVFFFFFWFKCFFFFGFFVFGVCVCVGTFLWILNCIVSVCWRILFCGVVWSHALFPGLLRCFPALRFPDDSSILLALELCVFFSFFFSVIVFFFFVCGDVPVGFGLYCVRLLAYALLWGCLVSCAVCWLVALFPGSSVS